jgi:prepilin-type N-terminal cleavage/methylation domain-containing protein
MKCLSLKRDGFTLIELLVVISIISLLSTVVLSSLKTARSKAVDTAIKTELINLRSQGAIYHALPAGYTGLCTDGVVQKALTFAASSTNSNIQINTTGGLNLVTCNSTTNGFAIQAPFKTDPSKFFCVDFNSSAIETSQSFTDGSTVVCGTVVVSGPGSQTRILAGTITDDASFGTVAWSNPGNAMSSDNVYATVVLAAENSHRLKATDFGFSIPAGATIKGIITEMKAKTLSGNVSFGYGRVKNGITGGVGGAGFSTTENYISLGSSSYLWNTTWTPSDINNSGFGFYVYTNNLSTDTVYIDHIRITVYYDVP